MQQSVKSAVRKAEAARVSQEAAWKRWDTSQSVSDMQAWSAAVDAQRAAEDAADRAEVEADARETEQADWWDAAVSNARCAA